MAAYTTIDNPELYFQNKIYTGNGTDNTSITLDGDENMQSDLIAIKRRNAASGTQNMDSVRGAAAKIAWNESNAEESPGDILSSFDSNGFTLGDSAAVNGSSDTFVAWCWKESATAGFDIITYSGTGSAKNESHSLSATPHWILTKCRSTAQSWATHHKSYSATEKVMYLDNNNALASTDPDWITAVSSSTISLGGSGSDANTSGRTYVAYLWSEKQGFSKFGSFTGNGNDDGTFVHTGFRPAWTMIKCTSATDHWPIDDNKRSTSNFMQNTLRANLSNAEYTGSAYGIDFLSNGFKVRNDDGQYNLSGGTFVYMAFAEAPFVNSNGVPANAR